MTAHADLSPTLQLAIDLIRRPSVTPVDADCQKQMMQRLGDAGFTLEPMRIEDVDNFWATHGNDDGPVLCFAGHTDVVPPGPREAWQSDPFAPQIRDGVLYGRGAADMKGSVAAFVIAAEQFVAAHPQHTGTLAVLLTSDEEGDAIDGVRHVARLFAERARSNPETANLNTLDELLLLGGGIPLFAGNELVGAMGVAGSGGGEQDESCAIKAAEKTGLTLTRSQ